ncbi:MAG: DUF58 domain-containing protein [Bryobacterales bacterium]|jgi:uncharacterized protein (DUF58 family)|nr:DUF58 domain-containing protein [Bryobacterales bacterium]
MAASPIIDKKFLERLERLTLRWRKSFPGTIGGHHVSRLKGAGQEFLDHRQFTQGDDLRSVNWRAYMRLEKLFLKVFQMEPHIPIRVMLDVSASMGLGKPSKLQYMQRLAAALVYVGVVRLETMQLIPFSSRLHEDAVAGGGRHRFAPVVDFLSALKPEGRSDAATVIPQFANRYLQRGLLIVMSDFFDKDDLLRQWQSLALLGHELFLIHLANDEDRNPPWQGLLEVVDAETGEARQMHFDEEARRQYTESFDAFFAEFERMALRNEGRYVYVDTAMPVDEVLFGALGHLQGAAG